MNYHGVAVLDFVTVFICDQLVIYPTHARKGILDILMTEVPDLVQVTLVVLICSSYHFSFSAGMAMSKTVPHLCFSIKVFMQQQVN